MFQKTGTEPKDARLYSRLLISSEQQSFTGLLWARSPKTLLKNTSLVNLSSPATLPCCCFLVITLWLTLCDPRDCSLPDSSSVHGISQARIFPQQGWNLHPPALAGGVFTPEPPLLPQESTVKRTKHRVNDWAHSSRPTYSVSINYVSWSVWAALTKISKAKRLE